MDVEVPVLSGFLTIPTQSGFSLNRISKKKSSNPKYCLLFKSSRHGIERLEIGDTKDDKNPKIITLENCVKITQDNTTGVHIINVVTKTGTLTLNAQNEEDLKNWVIALKSVAFRDKNSRSVCNSTVIEEHNDLYCSSYGENYFTVQLIPSETSVRCYLEPKTYTLLLTATELQLKSFEEDKKLVAKWPYRYIRKYGYRDGKFTFEAGRKCDTGEGMFSLDHNCPQEIFRCMGAKMQSMKKLMNGESMASLDCGENQLNAALSMEPGSRSPLPPSPNHISTSEMDISASIRSFLLSDSANNSSSSSAPLIISNNKHIPNKPPRKALNLVIGNNSFTTSEKSIIFCSPTDESAKTTSEKYRRFQNYEPITPISMSNENVKPGNGLHVVKSAPDIKTTCIIKNNLHSPSSPQLPNLPEPNKIRNISSPSIPISPTINSNNNSNSNNNTNNVNNNCSSNNTNNNNNTNNSYKKLTEVTVIGEDRDYESIQNITEAWKTMGIDDVKHTEHVKTPEDNHVEFVWQRSKSLQETLEKDKIIPPPVMRIVEIDPEGNYDRLQFFGTNNKTKLTSSGYKTIISVISPGGGNNTNNSNNNNNNNKTKSISDDYEIVGSPDTQSCRLADDSYLGYGVLRKPSIPGPQIASGITTTIIDDNDVLGLDHHKYNGLDYAVISKPKRV